MEDLLTDILEASTSAVRPSGAAGEGVNNWHKCPIPGILGTTDRVLETAISAAPTTAKKRKQIDLQLTSSQVSDETCDAAAAAVIALVNAQAPHRSPKMQRCLVAPDTPRTPSRVMLPPMSPSTPDAAAAVASASLRAHAATVPALQLANSPAAVAATEAAYTVPTSAQQCVDKQQQQQDLQQQAADVCGTAAQQQCSQQQDQQELLFSPPSSPVAGPAALPAAAAAATVAPTAVAHAASNSPAPAAVVEQTGGPLLQHQQLPALQSLRLVASQLSIPGSAPPAAAGGSPTAAVNARMSPCQFTPATQATLQATTANVIAADALAVAMAAARINHKSPALSEQQQHAAAVLPDWLCRSSADLAASAAVVRSSLLNTTAALARLQQQMHVPSSAGVAPSSPAVAGSSLSPAAVVLPASGVSCLGLHNSSALQQQQQQQQQWGSVVVGVPVAGARVMCYPAEAAAVPAAAAAGGCRPVAGTGVAGWYDDQLQFDQDMDDAVSCNSTPQSAAAAARSPRSPCWQQQQQEGSNSNGVNECDDDTDDTASSGYTNDSSSDGSGSSSDDDDESEDPDDPSAVVAAAAAAAKAAAKASRVDGSHHHPEGLTAVMVVLV